MITTIDNYTFDASEKTITFNDYVADGIDLERVLIVNNATAGENIYANGIDGKGGTVDGNVLILEQDTTTMADTDKLFIRYDDEEETLPVNPLPLAMDSDTITTYPSTGYVMNELDMYEVKTKIIDVSASGDTELLAAQVDVKYRVIGLNLTWGGTTNVRFKSGSTSISGLKYGIQGSVLQWNPLAQKCFDTAVGAALNINLSAAQPVGGELLYIEMP